MEGVKIWRKGSY